MKTGWGTNEKLIISILAHRNSAQRSLIRSAYAATYNEDLLKALDKELSSDFEVIKITLSSCFFFRYDHLKQSDCLNKLLLELKKN